MEQKELFEKLEELQKNIEGKTKTEVKELLVAFEKTLAEKFSTPEELKKFEGIISELKGKHEEQIGSMQKHIDALDVKLKEGKMSHKEVKSSEVFKTALAEEIKAKKEAIAMVSKGRSATLELKVVGDMGVATHLTGDPVKTYQDGIAAVPTQLVNMADLVPIIQSATGKYIVYRETTSEGGIASQTAGSTKSQIDYDMEEVVFNANYIAGFAVVNKQMLQDLPFLSSFLPMALRRDYMKAENTIFYTALTAAATASGNGAQTTVINRIILDIGDLEAADYNVNGVLVNPATWAAVAAASIPGSTEASIVNFQNGVLRINGIIVYKASFVDPTEYIVGDFSMAKKVVVDGLAVELFEQDSTNVRFNKITARVESRTVLAIDREEAFVLGSTVIT